MRRLVGSLASVAGHLVRLVRRLSGSLVGALGVALVSFGLWLAWAPLGFVGLGAFLILIDWRRG